MKSKIIKKPEPTTLIQNCDFYGVKWDAQAINTVQTVAEGLLANARALEKLADVFAAQNVQIDSLLIVNRETK